MKVNVRLMLILAMIGYAAGPGDSQIPGNGCLLFDAGKCTKCNFSYYLDSGQCKQCPEHCTNCENELFCAECETGFRGTLCSVKCNNCQPGTECDMKSGYCLDNCTDGSYGYYCNKTCDTGCVKCYRWYKHLCFIKANETCRKGSWGPGCNNSCSFGCTNNTCDVTDGHCLDGCKPGYTGGNCTKDISKKKKGDFNGTFIGIILAVMVLIALPVVVFVCNKKRCCRRSQELQKDKEPGGQERLLNANANTKKPVLDQPPISFSVSRPEVDSEVPSMYGDQIVDIQRGKSEGQNQQFGNPDITRDGDIQDIHSGSHNSLP